MGRIFISHAGKDLVLIDPFVDLLQAGLDISRTEIFCTSIDGMTIRSGRNFVQYIKDQMTDSDYVIMMITPSYYESAFCLCELGATWVTGKEAYPVLVPPYDYDNLEAVLEGVQAGKLGDKDTLNTLKDNLQEAGFGLKASTARWELKRDAFLNKLDAIKGELKGKSVFTKEEYDKADARNTESMALILEHEATIAEQKKTIENLKACKDAKEVQAVILDNQDEAEQFDQLTAAVRTVTRALPHKVIDILYRTQNGKAYYPDNWNNDSEWNQIRQGEEKGLLNVTEHGAVTPNETSPKIERALQKIAELETFMEHATPEFAAKTATENDFQFSLAIIDFWKKHLGMY